MSLRTTRRHAVILSIVALLFSAHTALAQNDAPNPYRTVEGWAKLPAGREWGATSAIYPTNDGEHIWIAERCGANLCVGSDVDPVMLFDMDGNMVKSFGSGMIVWPHGMYVDADDNVWIADSVGYAPVPEGIGHTIMKFSPEVFAAVQEKYQENAFLALFTAGFVALMWGADMDRRSSTSPRTCSLRPTATSSSPMAMTPAATTAS